MVFTPLSSRPLYQQFSWLQLFYHQLDNFILAALILFTFNIGEVAS